MNEQTLSEIRRKLDDYSMPAPEVPWDALEQALAANSRRRRIATWLKAGAAAAVAMLLAGGAATVGCACHMVGFAVASFRENGVSGLISQGVGTSMLQIPNVMRKPIILLPMIVSSLFALTNVADGNLKIAV